MSRNNPFTSRKIPRIGQGTWEMEHDANPGQALLQGLDLGLTHIDTAEMYGDGAVESIIGEALLGRRDEVFLVSKVLPYNASKRGTVEACERSLRALQTDRLDCYLLHWPGSEPVEHTVAAFEALKEAGKILSYGVRNFDVPDLEEFAAVAGTDNIACNQVLYHPGERAAQNRVIPWCQEREIPVVAYSPFGHGPLPEPNTPIGKALSQVAHEQDTSRHQVALMFATQLPGLWTIPKASTPVHVADNAQALGKTLTPAQADFLDAALPRNTRARGLPML